MRLSLRLERRDGRCVENRYEIQDFPRFTWPQFIIRVLKPLFESMKNNSGLMEFLDMGESTVGYNDYQGMVSDRNMYRESYLSAKNERDAEKAARTAQTKRHQEQTKILNDEIQKLRSDLKESRGTVDRLIDRTKNLEGMVIQRNNTIDQLEYDARERVNQVARLESEVKKLLKQVAAQKAKLDRSFQVPDFPYQSWMPKYVIMGEEVKIPRHLDAPFTQGCGCRLCRLNGEIVSAEKSLKSKQEATNTAKIRFDAAMKSFEDAEKQLEVLRGNKATRYNEYCAAIRERDNAEATLSTLKDRQNGLLSAPAFNPWDPGKIEFRPIPRFGKTIVVKKPAPYKPVAVVGKDIVNAKAQSEGEYRKALLNQGVDPDRATIQEFDFWTDAYRIQNT